MTDRTTTARRIRDEAEAYGFTNGYGMVHDTAFVTFCDGSLWGKQLVHYADDYMQILMKDFPSAVYFLLQNNQLTFVRKLP